MEIRSTAWRKLGVIGALVLVALIGDLRAPVSAAAPLVDARTDRTAVHRIAALQPIRSEQRASGEASHEETADEARLVPAIYAWDPDVRFVYYRHVSKWM